MADSNLINEHCRLMSLSNGNLHLAERFKIDLKADINELPSDLSSVDGYPRCSRYLETTNSYSIMIPDVSTKPKEMRIMLFNYLYDINTKLQLQDSGVLHFDKRFQYLQPIITTGDGNCLTHAVSIFMWGIHDYECSLRNVIHRVLVDDAASGKHAIKARWQNENSVRNSAVPGGGLVYNTVEWDSEWKIQVDMCKVVMPETRERNALPYESLDDLHIFVLCNILRRPIIVLADKMYRSACDGTSLAPNLLAGIYLPVLWPPGETYHLPVIIGYHQHHFVPLVPYSSKNLNDEEWINAVPLVDKFGQLLKVHFLMPEEKERMEELLHNYLQLIEVRHATSNNLSNMVVQPDGGGFSGAIARIKSGIASLGIADQETGQALEHAGGSGILAAKLHAADDDSTYDLVNSYIQAVETEYRKLNEVPSVEASTSPPLTSVQLDVSAVTGTEESSEVSATSPVVVTQCEEECNETAELLPSAANTISSAGTAGHSSENIGDLIQFNDDHFSHLPSHTNEGDMTAELTELGDGRVMSLLPVKCANSVCGNNVSIQTSPHCHECASTGQLTMSSISSSASENYCSTPGCIENKREGERFCDNCMRAQTQEAVGGTLVQNEQTASITSSIAYEAQVPSSSSTPSAAQAPNTSSIPRVAQAPNTSSIPSVAQAFGTSSIPCVAQAPNTSSMPNVPQAPNTPSIPSLPQAKNTSSIPSLPQAPNTSSIPSLPQAPNTSSIPSVPQAPKPSVPQAPNTSSIPSMAQAANTSSIPSVPQAPNTSSMPSLPQAPNTSSIPNVVQAPGTSSMPSVPRAPNTSTANSLEAVFGAHPAVTWSSHIEQQQPAVSTAVSGLGQSGAQYSGSSCNEASEPTTYVQHCIGPQCYNIGALELNGLCRTCYEWLRERQLEQYASSRPRQQQQSMNEQMQHLYQQQQQQQHAYLQQQQQQQQPQQQWLNQQQHAYSQQPQGQQEQEYWQHQQQHAYLQQRAYLQQQHDQQQQYAYLQQEQEQQQHTHLQQQEQQQTTTPSRGTTLTKCFTSSCHRDADGEYGQYCKDCFLNKTKTESVRWPKFRPTNIPGRYVPCASGDCYSFALPENQGLCTSCYRRYLQIIHDNSGVTG